MQKNLPSIIQNATNILLHLHPKPDPDSIGSALATYHAMKGLGKNVTIMQGDSILPLSFSFLPGYDVIVKNDYFDIDLSQFDLFIIQDSGSKQLVSRKGEVIFPPHLKTLVIDHHKTNVGYGDENLIDISYAATAEYLYNLFVLWEIDITPEIAACLYIGIYGDTGGFRYPSTTPQTMRIVSKLAEIYPDFTKLSYELENNNTPGKIAFDALALGNVEVHGSVALSAVSFDEMQKRGITREDSDSNVISNAFISVKGWNVGVTLIEKAPHEISISFRSKDGTDVSAIAEKIGGGGHKPAAGALLLIPLEEAKKKVLEAI